MKKKMLAALLLAAVCAGCLVWANVPKTALLENDIPMGGDPNSSSTIEIDDNDIPLAEVPKGDSEEDPFSQFTEDELTILNEVLDLVNSAREEAGLDPLELDPTLCGAAQVRAEECVGSFSHTRPNGDRYKTAITEAGLSANYTGENIATGHTGAKQVVDAWMKSEGHRANILNEHYTKLGVGFEANTGNRYRGYAWAQLFMSDPK